MAEGLVNIIAETGNSEEPSQSLSLSRQVGTLARGFQRVEDTVATYCDEFRALETRLDERMNSEMSGFKANLDTQVEKTLSSFSSKLQKKIQADVHETLQKKFGFNFEQAVQESKQIAARLQFFDASLSKKVDNSLVTSLLQQQASLLGSSSNFKFELAALTERMEKVEKDACLAQTGNCTSMQLLEAVHPLKLQLEEQNTALLSKADSSDLSSLSATVRELQGSHTHAPQGDAPKVFPRRHDIAGRRIQGVPQQTEKRHQKGSQMQVKKDEESLTCTELEEIKSDIRTLQSTLGQKAALSDLHPIRIALQNLAGGLDKEVEQATENKVKNIHSNIMDHLERFNGKWDIDLKKLRNDISNNSHHELTRLRSYVDGLNAKSRDKWESLSDVVFNKVDLAGMDQMNKNLTACFEDGIDDLDKKLQSTNELLKQTIERITEVAEKLEVHETRVDSLAQLCNEHDEMLEITALYTALPPSEPNGYPKGENTGDRRRLRRKDVDELIASVARKAETTTMEKWAAEIERIHEFLIIRFPQFRTPHSPGPRKYLTGPMSEYRGDLKTAGPRRVQFTLHQRSCYNDSYPADDGGSEALPPANDSKMPICLQPSNQPRLPEPLLPSKLPEPRSNTVIEQCWIALGTNYDADSLKWVLENLQRWRRIPTSRAQKPVTQQQWQKLVTAFNGEDAADQAIADALKYLEEWR